jgi:inorganic pyrophosphatase
MVDSGEKDEKIIAVPAGDPRYADIHELDDLGEHFKKELTHYFEHYKDLQGKKVEANNWGDKAEALKVLSESIED